MAARHRATGMSSGGFLVVAEKPDGSFLMKAVPATPALVVVEHMGIDCLTYERAQLAASDASSKAS